MRYQRFTSQEVTFLVETHSTHTIHEQAKVLGRTYVSIRNWRKAAIRKGLITIENRHYNALWTDKKQRLLEDLLRQGYTITAMMEVLHVSESGIRTRLTRRGDSVYTFRSVPGRRVYSPAEAARLFGISRRKLFQWIDGGLLRVEPYQYKKQTTLINESAIQAFMEDRQTWKLWSVDRIDSTWRPYAEWARNQSEEPADSGTWLTKGEVAERLNCTVRAIRRWRESGLFKDVPSQIVDGKLYFWSEDIDLLRSALPQASV